MIRIKLYTKPGCWYCDNAEEMLRGLELKYSLDIERVDITGDDEIYELYRYDVPVLEFPDGSHIHKHIKIKVLKAKLSELNESRQQQQNRAEAAPSPEA